MSNWPIQLRIVGATEADENTTVRLRAILDFDDGAELDVSDRAAWSGPNIVGGLVTIGNVTGHQSFNYGAQYNDPDMGILTAAHSIFVYDLNIPPVLYGISIIGPQEALKNTSEEYRIVAQYTNGKSEDIVPTIFTSSRSAVAGVEGTTVIFKNIRGSIDVRLSASYTLNGVTRTAFMDVMVIDNAIYPVGAELRGPIVMRSQSCSAFSLIVDFEDGGKQQVEPVWYVDGPAKIDHTGELTTDIVSGIQTVMVVASYSIEGVTVSDSLDLTVFGSGITVRGISIDGPDTVREGLEANYTTVLHFSDGTITPVIAEIQNETSNVQISNNVMLALPTQEDSDALLRVYFKSYEASKTVRILHQESAITHLEIECDDVIHSGQRMAIMVKANYLDGTSAYVPAALSVSHPNCKIVNGELQAGTVSEDTHIRILAAYSSRQEVLGERMVKLIRRQPQLKYITIECPDVLKGEPVLVRAHFDDSTYRIVEVPVFANGKKIEVGFTPEAPTVLTATYEGVNTFKEVWV